MPISSESIEHRLDRLIHKTDSCWIWIGRINSGGYGVFDLKQQTAQLVHRHDSAVFEGWPERVAWSPDGQWLALYIYSREPDSNGIWIVRADDGAEFHLENGYPKMIWSPNGRWLAAGRTLYEVGTWQPQLLNLPADAEIVAWVNPAPQ